MTGKHFFEQVPRHIVPRGDNHLRIAALLSLAVLSIAYLQVLVQATAVVGGRTRLLLIIATAFVAAVVAATYLPLRTGGTLTGIGFAIGLFIYAQFAPGGWAVLTSVELAARNILALLSGFPVLSIIGADVWVATVAPVPVFLSWYLALRSKYASATAVGIATVLLFIAMGDLTTGWTIVGLLAAVGTVGFGELERAGASLRDADVLAILIAVMLVLSLSVSVVPGGGAEPIHPEGEHGSGTSTETSLLAERGEISISGEPTLDPRVRFTIEADRPQHWRVDAYDRYTGTGWVQSGERTAFEGNPPISETHETTQMTVTAELDAISPMPARWRASEVSGTPDVTTSPADGLAARGGLAEDESYTVVSSEPAADRETLVTAGTSYPDSIEERYTQLPASMPGEVEELTDDLVAETDSPYEAGEVIEQYLIETNEYSLDVPPPEEDVAYEQLFERDEGYCTFFATTMVAMLRTQDIPARMVSGYSTGERVAEDRWVVRGLNAHAWVEMYVPGVGWVEFDPTPGGAYDDVRQQALADARAAGNEEVDTEESGGPEWELDPDEHENLAEYCDHTDAIEAGHLTEEDAMTVCTATELAAMEGIDPPSASEERAQDTDAFEDPADSSSNADSPGDGEDPGGITLPARPSLPSGEQVVIALVVLVAGVAGLNRMGAGKHVHQLIGVYWQGREREPDQAIIRAWNRLERYLGAEYSERRRGETVRDYVNRLETTHELDPRVRTVARTYERARYGTTATSPETATETVQTVNELVGLPVPGFSLKSAPR